MSLKPWGEFLEKAQNEREKSIKRLKSGAKVFILLCRTFIDGLEYMSYREVLELIIKPQMRTKLEETPNEYATPNTILWLRTHPLIWNEPSIYLENPNDCFFIPVPLELFNDNYFSIKCIYSYDGNPLGFGIENDILIYYDKFFIDKKYSFCDAIAEYYNSQNS